RVSKARDERGQHVGSWRRAGADDQRSSLKTVELCERLPAGGERSDDACRVIAEDPAGLGQRDGSGVANEEPYAELLLEFAHVLGQGRLREMDAFRRAAEALRLRHAEKDLELADRHRPFAISPTSPISGCSLCRPGRRSSSSANLVPM